MGTLRQDWDTWDPMLIAEGLFAAANIFRYYESYYTSFAMFPFVFLFLMTVFNVFSSLKLVYIFSVNPYLGPLQVSLGRMVMDIFKFFLLYVLVLFAFSCGKYSLYQ